MENVLIKKMRRNKIKKFNFKIYFLCVFFVLNHQYSLHPTNVLCERNYKRNQKNEQLKIFERNKTIIRNPSNKNNSKKYINQIKRKRK
jgi:hypothetical protein